MSSAGSGRSSSGGGAGGDHPPPPPPPPPNTSRQKFLQPPPPLGSTTTNSTSTPPPPAAHSGSNFGPPPNYYYTMAAANTEQQGSSTTGAIAVAVAATATVVSPSFAGPPGRTGPHFPQPPSHYPPPPPPPSVSSSAAPMGMRVDVLGGGGVPPTTSATVFPTAPPHQSTAPIHVLQSAPPSGNFMNSATPLAAADQPLPSWSFPFPPPPTAATVGPPTPTLVTLPPPTSQHSAPSQPRSGVQTMPTPPPSQPLPHPPHTIAPVLVPTQVPTVADEAPALEENDNIDNVAPPRLPPTTFLSKGGGNTTSSSSSSEGLPILARRQTHLPILVLATEAAHQLAWKNKLRLVDLLEGLSQPLSTTTSGQSASSSTTSAASYPFRSVTRQLHVSDVAVRFLEPEQLYVPHSDDDAQLLLSHHALLQESDGDLAKELTVLEDQVDTLLDEDPYGGDYDGADATSASAASTLQPSGGGDATSSQHHSSYVYDRHIRRDARWEQVVRDAHALTSPLHIPWLWRYRVASDHCTDQFQWDLMAAPIVVLCVATTRELAEQHLGSIGALQSLVQSPYALPRPYHTGLLDPNAVRKEVLVLHDNVDGPRSGDIDDGYNEAALRQALLQNFGSNAALVRCNSIPRETARLLALEETSDPWGGGGALGTCLSVSDRVSLRKYVAALVSSAVLPAMERRVADLNAVVSDKKKGVRNVLKSLWGGGRSGTGSAASGGTGSSSHGTSLPKLEVAGAVDDAPVLYRHDSVESQTRLLADSLFLMKDYEAALGIYRLIRDDYKQDKAHAHYASVQEMMALCMYLTDPYGRSKDIFSYCENALMSYSRAAEDERPPAWGEKPGRPASAPRATRLATRLCLVLISTQNVCTDRHLEVADLLASASSHETSLGAAVLLEQSSSHYFMADMYRKYAFHMLMSGHMFRAAEQDHHAFRCFTSSLHIYRDSRWEELHNHIRSALAAQLYAMNRMSISLQLYAKLVGSTEGGRVSAKSQQKFVNHLLEICNEHPKKALTGADRMAVSAKLSGEQRDTLRKERLDRIVQVIRYTKSASRVLEIPNIDLPGVDDSSVAVLADQTSHHESWIPSFGDVQRGSDSVWDDLQIAATAELDIFEGKAKANDARRPLAALSKFEDPELRKAIAQIDREKTNRVVAERTRKREGKKSDLPVRAQMEPLSVEFAVSNPLAIPVDLTDLQIVAKMTEEIGDRICTNEDAIKITPLVSYDEKQRWSFLGSGVAFEIPDFCRVSTVGPDPLKQPWKAAEEISPFFVVTKTTLTLEPESRRTVSASICPLIRGTLEVVGVRCRLLDDVWVFHPFDLKGPLLQNTRENRANRIRAESTLLKAKVERGMPCLKAELVRSSKSDNDDHGPLLQGQIGSWILRFANVGTGTARNLYLKSNLPWFAIDVADGEEAIEPVDGSRFCCIGCSGTLFHLPIRGSSLKKPDQIDPGEAIEIPVRIRATGVGRQEFYMLFRYEMVDEAPTTSSASSPEYRWLRKMVEVPVYPSLSFSASAAPSFRSPLDHMLTVEVSNNRTDRPDKLDLTLDSLVLASRCYRLESLPGQFGGDKCAKLGWQERALMHYRIVPFEEASTSIVLSKCECSPSSAAALHPDATTSILHYPCVERAHDNFLMAFDAHQKALGRATAAPGGDPGHPRSIAQIRRANTSALSGSSHGDGDNQGSLHATSIGRLCPADGSAESVCLVLCWRDEVHNVSGQHYLRDLEVRPASPKGIGCPITVTAEHPQAVTGDFSRGPARVPFQVTLRNRLVYDPVEFQFSLRSSERFDVVGPECFKSALSGGEELSVPLEALIPSPGVYNLQTIRLTVDEDDAPTYDFPMQWLVTVSQE